MSNRWQYGARLPGRQVPPAPPGDVVHRQAHSEGMDKGQDKEGLQEKGPVQADTHPVLAAAVQRGVRRLRLGGWLHGRTDSYTAGDSLRQRCRIASTSW